MFFYKSPIKIKPPTFRLVNFLGKSPTRKKDTLGDQKRAPVEMEMAPFPQRSMDLLVKINNPNPLDICDHVRKRGVGGMTIKDPVPL